MLRLALYEKEEKKKETERRKEATDMIAIMTVKGRQDVELDDILSNVEDDDDNDDESSVNSAEEGNSDNENDISTKSIQFSSMNLR